MTTENHFTGKVILAGAGPGDPELITLKTLLYLGKADVIIVDRLVSYEILKQYANPEALVISAGKQARNERSVSQTDINGLLVKYALQGKLVVRLKGGDVSIFSNIFDELQALVEHDVPYEIIPGITAASGAAAYAGIPLTARGFADSVRILTYYTPGALTDKYWKDLADTNDTLVFYMSSETLDQVVEKLVRHNISPFKLLAVIEQATTSLQKVYVSDLYEYASTYKRHSFISPSLVIIGKVVGLHKQFGWLDDSNLSNEYYFKPVDQAGGSISCVHE